MEHVKQQTAFTKDKPVIILAIVGGLLALAQVLVVLIRLSSHDFKVPVQYIVNDGSVLQTSSWYTLYSLALVAALGAGVSIFLAHRIHKTNRVLALGVLITSAVIGVIGLLVANALLGLVSRV